MEKLSFSELTKVFTSMNEEKGVKTQYSDNTPKYGVVVFDSSNWKTKYSLESRSYKFRSDNKYFIPGLGGNSIFCKSLDNMDEMRLDWYLGQWKIEYCYIEENGGE